MTAAWPSRAKMPAPTMEPMPRNAAPRTLTRAPGSDERAGRRRRHRSRAADWRRNIMLGRHAAKHATRSGGGERRRWRVVRAAPRAGEARPRHPQAGSVIIASGGLRHRLRSPRANPGRRKPSPRSSRSAPPGAGDRPRTAAAGLASGRRRCMSTATETALGTHSEVGKLRTVMVHRPDLAHERLSPSELPRAALRRRHLGAARAPGARRVRRPDARARRRGAAAPRAARRRRSRTRRRASGCCPAACGRRRSR